MKAFFVFEGQTLKDASLMSVLSAFTDVEVIGLSDDLIEALEAVRRDYPETVMCDGDAMANETDFFSDVLEAGRPLMFLLTKDYGGSKKCACVGVDLSQKDSRWVIGAFSRMLHECRWAEYGGNGRFD